MFTGECPLLHAEFSDHSGCVNSTQPCVTLLSLIIPAQLCTQNIKYLEHRTMRFGAHLPPMKASPVAKVHADLLQQAASESLIRKLSSTSTIVNDHSVVCHLFKPH